MSFQTCMTNFHLWNIEFKNLFFYVAQKNKIDLGLEWHEDEKIMTEF